MLALAGCVGPAAISGGMPLQPTARDVVASPTIEQPVAMEAAERAASLPAPTLGAWRAGQGLAGVDVSRHQPSVDWVTLLASGHGFAYVKATEGTNHVSPTHDEQRRGSREAGMVQGAYHYARPGQSSGTLQARFFHANGGAWAPDGTTMPGALDLERAEHDDPCHGLTPTEMVGWIREFTDEYRRLSGRIPVIYTRAEFWDACTGGDSSFSDHPLWLFDHGAVPGTPPTGWDRPTLWQRAVVDNLDRNVFFGTTEQLVAWASAPLR